MPQTPLRGVCNQRLTSLAAELGGIGIPSGIIGFDYAHDTNPPAVLGTANGIVNVGGFLPGVLMILAIGLVLDWHQLASGGRGVETLYSLTGFRLAFLVQYLVVGIGVVRLLQLARRPEFRRSAHDERDLTSGK